MATPSEQLQAMRELKENWDGYGAAAPHPSAIDLALELADLLEALITKSSSKPAALHVGPTRIGGILIEWEDHFLEHEVEINPDGSIGFLHRNKTTGYMETRKFSPGPLGVVHPGFLQELRQLLAA